MTHLKTLQDAFAYFADPKNCTETAIKMRWPDGVIICPTCGSTNVAWVPSRSLFQCKTRHAKCQFSVKVGTIFEDSPISLSKWFVVMWMLASCRNGISSYEVKRTIGVTQKTAWFMLHRLREAMKMEGVVLTGEVEADESYYGGKIKNKHTKARKQGHYKDKSPIFGMVERGGLAVAMAVPDAKSKTIVPLIEASVSKDAIVHTDDFPLYDPLKSLGYTHQVINHSQDRFAKGTVSTNRIENLWSNIKRTLAGTYIAVQSQHLNAYVAEGVFRFNCRFPFVTEAMRFQKVLEGTQGRRLTYKALTART